MSERFSGQDMTVSFVISLHGEALRGLPSTVLDSIAAAFKNAGSNPSGLATKVGTSIAVAQGIAYLDFGFIEPALLAKVMVDQQNGKAVPEQVEGKLVARVSFGLDVLARLQHQMQQMFLSMRQAQGNGNGMKVDK